MRHDVTVLEADYGKVKAMSKLLEEHAIDTLVCAIGVVSKERNANQLNLIRAAADSTCTTRYVISSYDMEHLRESVTRPMK